MISAELLSKLSSEQKTWLITGGAGFIGSHLVEVLLQAKQKVRVLDNFSSGKQENLAALEKSLGPDIWKNFELFEGDIRNSANCLQATDHVDFVLHHAAMGSVPASIADPQTCHDVNTTGTLNILTASRQNNVQKFIFASSAAVYGNNPELPKFESMTAPVLSPYAASKMANELYAQCFFNSYGLKTIGFRYFNVFGPRQDPQGSYASVIPRWIQGLKSATPIHVYGDGLQTRDFCHVSQVVQANIKAALTDNPEVYGQVFNVGIGESTSLLQLLNWITAAVNKISKTEKKSDLQFSNTRAGDIKHSRSSIDKIVKLLDFIPDKNIQSQLESTVLWYIK